MTFHSGMDWKFEDGCTDELVTELVDGLIYNRDYNRHEGHDVFISCYGIFCLMDCLVENIGLMLDRFDGTVPEDMEPHLEWVSKEAPKPELVREITTRVVEAMVERGILVTGDGDGQ